MSACMSICVYVFVNIYIRAVGAGLAGIVTTGPKHGAPTKKIGTRHALQASVTPIIYIKPQYSRIKQPAT